MSPFYPWLLLLLKLGLVSGLQPEASPFSQMPFLSIWNAPTANCLSLYGVDLDLGTFSIVHNQNQTFVGENMTIFYSDKLGLYPNYTMRGEAVHGGVPQNASLEEHLRVASEDIQRFIPDRDFQGLAVVDWEDWRPVWARNWEEKRVYWEGSTALVKAQHPDWRPQWIIAEAQLEFEEAGRKFMQETLKLGQRERPNGLWGFYGFPSCYNHRRNGTYTGECPPIEIQRNDQLAWLWNSSTALYPDIYLSADLRDLGDVVLRYAHHVIQEGMRIAARVTPSPLPVFPYARIVYCRTFKFLSQEHLVYTIGESAALGSAGVVLWGDAIFSRSKNTCETVKSFIDETLGSYLVNVTAAATLCSQSVCSSKGRCQRKDPKSRAYLHLDPAEWKVVSEKRPKTGRNYRVLGQMTKHQVTLMKSEFRCGCYQGWEGESCSKPRQV